jgi:PAS domain S-box-containing protein
VVSVTSEGGWWQRLALPRELLMELPAAVAYLSGPDLVIEFANGACRRLAAGGEVTGLPIREVFPDLAAQGCFEVAYQVLRTGHPAIGSETGVRLQDRGLAERRFADFHYQPVRKPGGGVSGVLLSAVDVTAHVRDRRRLEAVAARLTETQERYRTLFETLPQGIIRYEADGSVFSVNPAATRILGLAASEMRPLWAAGRSVREDGTPYRQEELPVQVALRTGEVVPDVIVGKPHARTGELRWLRVTAVPDERDEQGRPQRAYAVLTDLTDQYRMEAQLRESTRLLGRLRDANVLGVVLVGEERVYEANDAFLDIVGYTRDDVAAGRVSYKSLTPPEFAARDRDALAQLRRANAFQPFEKEYVHHDGHRVPVLVGAAVVNRRPLRWVTFVVDLTARQRAEQERAALLVRERAARADADHARERLAFLLRAGSMVAATRNRREMLDHAAQIMVPALADHCMVMVPAADGSLQAAAVAHRDPARAPLLAEFRRYKIPAAGPMVLQAAYTSGTSQLMRDVDIQLPQWRELAPGLIDVLAQLRANSVLATPLLVEQRPVGVLALAREAGRPAFAVTDMQVVEEFARRLSEAVAAADTFAREHAVAETLQRSLLPDALPTIPGLDLAVRYLPATDGAAVGGDWYDAFRVDARRVGLVIGDTIGHSITSASVMGQIRTLLRAYALENPSPGDLLRRTNLALARLLPDAMATVTCAMLDLPTGELAYASAGHPPPLVKTAAGADYLDGATGIMLGTGTDADFTVGRGRLPPGAGLLLYTDGLIEDRHRDISAGLGLLASALRRSAARTAEQMCDAAEQAMLGSEPRVDDVCLLAIRTESLLCLSRSPPGAGTDAFPSCSLRIRSLVSPGNRAAYGSRGGRRGPARPPARPARRSASAMAPP